jgi:hypothetical protein
MKLVGTKSNRAAIGARIRVEMMERNGITRDVYATLGNGSSFGASTLTQEVGLGMAEKIVELEIWWPSSDLWQRFKDVPLDSRILITEGEDGYKTLE